MKKIFTLVIAALGAVGATAQTLPGLSDIITEQPEGTLYKDVNHYFEGAYTSGADYLVYDYLGDGYLSDIVKADDGSLFIKNPFGFFQYGDIWIKAVKGEGNTYEVHMPQAVYDNEGGDDAILYAWRYVKNGESTYATKDAASQVVEFELRGDSLVKVGAQDAFIGLGTADGYFYGYGDTVSIYNKVKEAVPVPVDATKAVSYTMSYNNASEVASQKTVSVVFEGDKVFFGGFDESQPDLWFAGTLNGDQLLLDRFTYMGIDRSNTTYGSGHMYIYAFGWGAFKDADGNDKYGLYDVEQPTLHYDAATHTFSTDELTLAVNRGHNYYPYVYYAKPTLQPASSTSLNNVAAAAGVSTKYYDLAGRAIQRPAKGVFVKTTTTAEGVTTAKKVVVE